MVRYTWNPDKNDWLHQTRDLGFEDVVVAIQTGGLLDIVAHHNPTRYPRQQLLVIKIDDYAYMVPCTVEGDRVFSQDHLCEPEGDAGLSAQGGMMSTARQHMLPDKQAEMEHTLDEEERDLLQSFEAGEWVSVPDVAVEKARLEEAARNTLALSGRLTVRLTHMNLIALKARAAREGLTPQALAGSILHKYITGQLVPREKAEKATQ